MPFLLGLLPLLPNIFLKVLGAGETAISEGARQEINRRNAKRDERLKSGDVIIAGMQHKVFWIPWLVAAIPTSVWYAWGMVDSLWPGHLPHVAALPPQLKEYADIVFGNIFYVGGGVAGAQMVAGAIARRK